MIDEIFNYRESSFPAGEVNEEWENLSDEFEAMLTEEQVKMFHKLCDMQSDSTADEVKNAYIAGFKDGITLMTEVWDG